jgi:surfeit locus 1 family protein
MNKTALIKQRAAVQGVWVADKTVFLDNRQMNAKVGFFVLTPLRLTGSTDVVWVQRGWIPRNFEDRALLPRVATPEGVVTVEGRIAPPPSKLYELGASPSGPIRQNLDLEQFKAESGLPLLPVTLQQTGLASEGLLREWPAANLGMDKHYGYAFQWFALAALIAFLYLWFQIIQPYFHRTKDSKPHV